MTRADALKIARRYLGPSARVAARRGSRLFAADFAAYHDGGPLVACTGESWAALTAELQLAYARIEKSKRGPL